MDATGDAHIAYSDPTARSSWYSSDAILAYFHPCELGLGTLLEPSLVIFHKYISLSFFLYASQ